MPTPHTDPPSLDELTEEITELYNIVDMRVTDTVLRRELTTRLSDLGTEIAKLKEVGLPPF